MKNFNINPVRKILVPTDFSANAKNAAEYAINVAKKLESRVVLFHSTHLPVVSANEVVMAVDPVSLEKDSLNHLNLLKRELGRDFGQVEIENVTTIGFAVEEIIEIVRDQKIDLVVMGTKGASGMTEILIGSNTADVIEKCHCPVLAIPAESKFKTPSKVVFATNYADNDFQSIYLLAEILKPFNAEIIILHVDDNQDSKMEGRMLEWFKGQVTTNIPYDRFSFSLISGKNTMEVLDTFITENEIDILSVSMRKRNFFDKLTSRSLTRKLAYHTHVPLLAFHAYNVGGTPLF
ncbi:MAG TPA: universal stress protein [Bacteroidia bacterium]|nr:universal stress protein [Bacteroidia bacterium]